MNTEQLRATLQLRWNMSRNQWRRAGTFNYVVTMILAFLSLLAATVSFFLAAIAGYYLLGEASSHDLLMLWDIIVVIFLFLWSIGMATQLQSSELISLENFLHLPVSLSGAYILNFASSFASLSLLVFVPTAAGLCVASTMVLGVRMLLIVPLVFGFVLMVTALTYQFRSWLGRLMINKRRKGTVVALMTVLIVLLSQLPTAANFLVTRGMSSAKQQIVQRTAQRNVLLGKLQREELTSEEYNRQIQEIDEEERRTNPLAIRNIRDTIARNLLLAHVILPPAWLPMGIRAINDRVWSVVCLCAFGMTAIGGLSVRRTYQMTIQAYCRADARTYLPAPGVTDSIASRPLLVARQLPWLNEHQSAVTLTTFRSFLRAPETKTMVLTPCIFLGLFGSMILSGRAKAPPEWMGACISFGTIGMVIFGMSPFVLNIFAADHSGFRAYLLMPISRKDILIGKNLANAPLVAGLACFSLVIGRLCGQLSITQVVATLIQVINVFLLYCLVGNLVSIYFPMFVAPGSLKPRQPHFATILVQMAVTLFSPILLLPAVVAAVAEFVVGVMTDFHWMPTYTVVSLLELAVIVAVYRHAIAAQGPVLQRREISIMNTVGEKDE